MKVILLEDIKGVGKKGQLLNASDGHARNYLIPKKLAVEANASNLNELELKKKSEENKKKKELEVARAFATELESSAVTIAVKTGENGKLFGSVTNKEIAIALEDQTGHVIDKKKIVLDDAIKSVGEKTVSIKVHPKVTAKVTIKIIEG